MCHIFDGDGELAAGVASVEAIVSCLRWIQLNQIQLHAYIKFITQGPQLLTYWLVLIQENFLTSDWIRQFKCNICSAPVLMVDANLSPSALEASCQSTYF